MMTGHLATGSIFLTQMQVIAILVEWVKMRRQRNSSPISTFMIVVNSAASFSHEYSSVKFSSL